MQSGCKDSGSCGRRGDQQFVAPPHASGGGAGATHRMASRNTVAIFDAALAREQAQAELRAKVVPKKLEINEVKPGSSGVELDAATKARMANALAKEIEKIKSREAERRRRDPTFRPDALDLDRSRMLRFNRWVDYYERLGIERFASSTELKEAYRRLSLQLHPDKQTGKSESEREAVAERFHEVTQAHAILSEPATRQAYDRARDKLEAEYEAGITSTREEDKPPPSCVDVEASLEDMFVGCRKYVRFTRRLFEGTKWSRKDDDVFTLTVRPGELEGATYWFKNAGDVSARGKSDLVFVLRQAPHTTFERVGADLWWRPPQVESEGSTDAEADAALPAGCPFYFGRVPAFVGRGEWPGAGKPCSVPLGEVAAFAHVLPTLLGFDRSGCGEAVVRGLGMPLLAAGEDARRGSGAIEQREQQRGGGTSVSAAGAGAGAGADSPPARGDLIVKFRVAPPPPHSERRVLLATTASLRLPPIALLSSRGRQGQLPSSPLCRLVTQTVLPRLLCTVARYRVEEEGEGGTCSAVLRAVWLCIGGDGATAPSAASRQFIEMMRWCVPQMRWRFIVMPPGAAADRGGGGGVTCPLLDDEVEEVEAASLLLVEAVTDGAADKQPLEWDAARGALVEQPREPDFFVEEDAEEERVVEERAARKQHGWKQHGWDQEQQKAEGSARSYVVAWAPGVRVRAAPSADAAVVGIVRAGQVVRGVNGAPDIPGWVRLDVPLEGWVRCEEVASKGARRLLQLMAVGAEGAAAATVQTEAAAVKKKATAATAAALPSEEAKVADLERADSSEEEEVATDEKPIAQRRAERAYAQARLGGARAALHARACDGCVPAAADALRSCHYRGGVLVAIDLAATLVAECLLPYLVGLAPPKAKTPPHSSSSSASSASSVSSSRPRWRRLRNVALHGGGDDGKLGYAAVGLPPGSVAVALSSRGYAIRSVLGSAPPLKLSCRAAAARAARVGARQERARIERRREATLARIKQACVECNTAWPPVRRPHAAPVADYAGTPRGACTQCDACVGYLLPQTPNAMELMAMCAGCGCEADKHLPARSAMADDSGE